MIILSVLADQPHNGDLIAGKRLGVHIPFRKLSAEKLWNAMEVTQTQQILESVLAIGHSIVLEDGVTEVICQLEKYNAS
jgi:UDP:flavonoid glycosyltransferase YjiC (YdhE family)